MRTLSITLLTALLAVAFLVLSCGDEDDPAADDVRTDLAETDLAETDLPGEPDVVEEVGPQETTEDDLAGNDATEIEAADVVVKPGFPTFFAPEGVAVVGDRVFVTNTNGAWDDAAGAMVYNQGYVTIFNRETLGLEGVMVTAAVNPQIALEVSGKLAIVSSGTVEFDENWTMMPAAPGAVEIVDPLTLVVSASVEIPSGTPEALAGFPGSAAYDPDHEFLFVASGTAPYVYKVDVSNGDLSEPLLLYADFMGNDAVALAFTGGYIYAASFNQGLLYKIDPVALTVEGEPVDVTETDELEGPVDMVAAGGVLYVLHTLSSQVAAYDPATGSVEFLFTTGATPNRISHWDGKLFVVNSMDNNLTRYDIGLDESTTPFAAFDPGMNPWEMGIDTDGFGLVTGYMSNTLVRVSLESGEITHTIANQ